MYPYRDACWLPELNKALSLKLIIQGKSVSADMIARRVARCGDGTHFLDDSQAHQHALWGFGDVDIPNEDVCDLQQMKD